MEKVRTLNYHRQYQDLLPMLFPGLAVGAAGVIVKTVTFLVTEACPLRCTYCYECNKDHTKRMSKETARKAVDLILSPERTNGYIDQATDKGVIIEFIGGEPLLEAELLVYITDYFKQQLVLLDHPWRNHFMFSLTSNGVPWRDPKVKEFLLKNKGRVSLSITVDGDQELHDTCRVYPDGRGSYQDAADAVAFCRRFVPLRDTKVTFAPGNIQHLSRSVPHLFQMGFTDINANCVYEEGWTLEDARVFYRELVKLADWMVDSQVYQTSYCSIFDQSIGVAQGPEHTGNWCGGDGRMLAIGTDGRLFPCIRFMSHALGTPGRQELELGDVDRGIDAPAGNCSLCALRSLTRQSQSTQECLECPVSAGCGWCTGYNYDKFGTPDQRATFICWPHRARCMANAYYWDRIKTVTGYDAGVVDNVRPEHRALILEEA